MRSLSRFFCMIGLVILGISYAGAGNSVLGEQQEKWLIIHADDAGMCHSVNRATIDAMKQGLVRSASVMVPCPWFKEFAVYAAATPDGDFGIHLTLNSEWDNYRWGPVADLKKVPSLIDQEGYLWDNVQQVVENAKAEEVRIELRAQIQRALDFKVPLSHLDTHMGAVVSRPDLLEVYVELGAEFDLPVMFVRLSNEQIEESSLFRDRYRALLVRLERLRLPVLDRLEQHYDGNSFDERRATYLDTLRSIRPGVTQLIIHCGYDDGELRAITTSAARRDGDRRLFSMDADIRKVIQDHNIKLIDWKDFRRLNQH